MKIPDQNYLYLHWNPFNEACVISLSESMDAYWGSFDLKFHAAAYSKYSIYTLVEVLKNAPVTSYTGQDTASRIKTLVSLLQKELSTEMYKMMQEKSAQGYSVRFSI